MPRPDPGRSPGRPPPRAASPAVGIAVLLAVTTLLAATVAAGVGVHAVRDPAPQVRVTGTVSAGDGWPDGQVIELTHEAGRHLAVSDIELVVTLSRADRPARLSGFPTRRLTDEHVAGPAVFDEGYAGIDGTIDAAHTDGRWESGEVVAVRVARHHYDVRPDETVRVAVVHDPTDAVVARLSLVAA